MNTPLILKLSALIVLGGVHGGHAREVARVDAGKRVTANNTLKARKKGEQGSITFHREKVWEGRVAGELVTRQRVEGEAEYAAAWDDTGLLWESEKGAAEQFRDET